MNQARHEFIRDLLHDGGIDVGLGVEEYVAAAYENLLGYEDASAMTNAEDRLGYWVDRLESGDLNQDTFIPEFLYLAWRWQGDFVPEQDFVSNRIAVESAWDVADALYFAPEEVRPSSDEALAGIADHASGARSAAMARPGSQPPDGDAVSGFPFPDLKGAYEGTWPDDPDDPDGPGDPDDPDAPGGPGDPDDPDSPGAPGDPDGPGDPDDPDDPDGPGDPDDPDGPGDPDDPDGPGDPDDPDGPGDPDDPDGPGDPDDPDDPDAPARPPEVRVDDIMLPLEDLVADEEQLVAVLADITESADVPLRDFSLQLVVTNALGSEVYRDTLDDPAIPRDGTVTEGFDFELGEWASADIEPGDYRAEVIAEADNLAGPVVGEETFRLAPEAGFEITRFDDLEVPLDELAELEVEISNTSDIDFGTREIRLTVDPGSVNGVTEQELSLRGGQSDTVLFFIDTEALALGGGEFDITIEAGGDDTRMANLTVRGAELEFEFDGIVDELVADGWFNTSMEIGGELTEVNDAETGEMDYTLRIRDPNNNVIEQWQMERPESLRDDSTEFHFDEWSFINEPGGIYTAELEVEAALLKDPVTFQEQFELLSPGVFEDFDDLEHQEYLDTIGVTATVRNQGNQEEEFEPLLDIDGHAFRPSGDNTLLLAPGETRAITFRVDTGARNLKPDPGDFRKDYDMQLRMADDPDFDARGEDAEANLEVVIPELSIDGVSWEQDDNDLKVNVDFKEHNDVATRDLELALVIRDEDDESVFEQVWSNDEVAGDTSETIDIPFDIEDWAPLVIDGPYSAEVTADAANILDGEEVAAEPLDDLDPVSPYRIGDGPAVSSVVDHSLPEGLVRDVEIDSSGNVFLRLDDGSVEMRDQGLGAGDEVATGVPGEARLAVGDDGILFVATEDSGEVAIDRIDTESDEEEEEWVAIDDVDELIDVTGAPEGDADLFVATLREQHGTWSNDVYLDLYAIEQEDEEPIDDRVHQEFLGPVFGHDQPVGIVADPDGRVYVGFEDGDIQRFDGEDDLEGFATLDDEPMDMAVGPSGDLFVLASSRVERFDDDGDRVDEWPLHVDDVGLDEMDALDVDADGTLHLSGSYAGDGAVSIVRDGFGDIEMAPDREVDLVFLLESDWDSAHQVELHIEGASDIGPVTPDFDNDTGLARFELPDLEAGTYPMELLGVQNEETADLVVA